MKFEEWQAQQRQLAEAAAEAKKKQQQRLLVTGLGALAGMGLGYGLYKLLGTKTAKDKIKDSAERIADKATDMMEGAIEGIFNPDADPMPPVFQQGSKPDIKDAEFEILDDDLESGK